MAPAAGASLPVEVKVLLVLLSVGGASGFALQACRITDHHLLCAGCKLSSVPSDMPPTLTSADLSSNKLQKIRASDFHNLSSLTQLDLKRNHISQMDPAAFAALVSLHKLNLANNYLRALGPSAFYGLRNLTELNIHGNRIRTVASSSFTTLTSLTSLDLSFNALGSLAPVAVVLQQLPGLQTLLVRGVQLTSFRSWELTNVSLELSMLDLAENPLAVFKVTADVLPKLTWLNIGGPTRRKKMVWDVPYPFLHQVSTLDIGGLNLDQNEARTLLASFNSSLRCLRMSAMKQNPQMLINMSCSIPTLDELQLWKNKLVSITPQMFQLCGNLSQLDLGDNHIRDVDGEAFRPLQSLSVLSLHKNHLLSVPDALMNLGPTLAKLDLSNNNISSLGADDFASLTRLRHLSLHQNSISALQLDTFKNLSRLQVLKLQNNSIAFLHGAFKKHLPNLQVLQLDQNKLTRIERGELQGLSSLQNLTLRENQLSSLQTGSFQGLTKLTDLQLQSNRLTEDSIKDCVFCSLVSLRRLDLRDNHIRYKSDARLKRPPFSSLERLERLSIPGQHRRGKGQLPANFLQGLTNLRVFEARNIQLLQLPAEMFNSTPQLELLDISSNDIRDLAPQMFWPLKRLRSLALSRTSLGSLEFLLDANLTQLEFLQSKKNRFSVINVDVMRSLPGLRYLDLQGTSFTCDCDNAAFLRWVEEDNQTQVYDAYHFTCNYPPELKNSRLLELDVRSCSVDLGLICFISTTCAVLLVLTASFIYHFLRWQLAYAYQLLLAQLTDRGHRNAVGGDHYDAFISYSSHDEAWVFQELLPKLEGEQGWRLCLHHRDFQPGKPILDNITDAIYRSRNTICVISRRYLESEWCSREIQVASFRLFDERKDVLILVFLEEIPVALLSPFYRMRKLLKKWTYLSWPQAGENKMVFWEKLRQALVPREAPDGPQLCLTVMEQQR